MPVLICGHLLDLPFCEPVVKLSESGGRRPKGSDLIRSGPWLLSQQPTSYDGSLVDIQATTAFIHDLHSLSPFRNKVSL